MEDGKVKVVIIGCGAIGLNYGMRLLEAELRSLAGDEQLPLDVNFVLRRDYDWIAANGVMLESKSGTEDSICFTPEQLTGKLFRDTAELFAAKGGMDWVICAMKAYSITEDLHNSLRKIHRVGCTRYLIIMNGVGVEAKFSDWFGAENIYGGITFVAITRGPNPPEEGTGPLVVHCFKDAYLEIGHLLDKKDRLVEARRLWSNTKVEPLLLISECLLSARWRKLVKNIPASGITTALGGVTVDILCNDASLCALRDAVFDEACLIANTDIARQYRDNNIHHIADAAKKADQGAVKVEGGGKEGKGPGNGCSLPACPYLLDVEAEKRLMVEASGKAGAYKMSMVVDLISGRDMEIEHILQEPVRRARTLGLPESSYASVLVIVRMVEALSRIAETKRALGVPWSPTFVRELIK